MFFLRKSTLERLPVVMSGVRMGERALQIGIDDPGLAGAIAVKVGLSGHAAIAVSTERQAARARAAAAAAGVLADVQVATLDALPFSNDSFDVVVLHEAGMLPSSNDPSAVQVLRDSHRVLRVGGRIVVIARGARGLLARLRPADRGGGGATLAALQTAGFRAARLLAEREGYRFVEAQKG